MKLSLQGLSIAFTTASLFLINDVASLHNVPNNKGMTDIGRSFRNKLHHDVARVSDEYNGDHDGGFGGVHSRQLAALSCADLTNNNGNGYAVDGPKVRLPGGNSYPDADSCKQKCEEQTFPGACLWKSHHQDCWYGANVTFAAFCTVNYCNPNGGWTAKSYHHASNCVPAPPTPAPTPEPTGRFDWNITEFDPSSFVDISFSDARNGDEIKLNFFASDKATSVKVLDYDNCNTMDSANAITTVATPTRGSETLEVPLNIDQAAISSSSFYTASGDNNEKGTIEICVRIDLYADIDNDGVLQEDGESINFHETKLKIEIDMTSDFTVTGVTTNRTEATEAKKNASLEYDIDAYECDDGGNRLTAPKQYTQGDYLQIAVTTNSTSGVKVANVIEMILSGDTTYTSVDGSDASASILTQRDCSGTVTSGCKVKTMLVSGFFDDANPSPINVIGTCVMEFVRARRLSSFRRGLQQEESTTNEQFGLTVSLQPMNIEDITTQDGGENDMIDSASPGIADIASSIVVGMASLGVVVLSFFLI